MIHSGNPAKDRVRKRLRTEKRMRLLWRRWIRTLFNRDPGGALAPGNEKDASPAGATLPYWPY